MTDVPIIIIWTKSLTRTVENHKKKYQRDQDNQFVKRSKNDIQFELSAGGAKWNVENPKSSRPNCIKAPCSHLGLPPKGKGKGPSDDNVGRCSWVGGGGGGYLSEWSIRWRKKEGAMDWNAAPAPAISSHSILLSIKSRWKVKRVFFLRILQMTREYGRVVENRNVEGWRVGCNFIITSWRVIIPNPPQDDRFVR